MTAYGVSCQCVVCIGANAGCSCRLPSRWSCLCFSVRRCCATCKRLRSGLACCSTSASPQRSSKCNLCQGPTTAAALAADHAGKFTPVRLAAMAGSSGPPCRRMQWLYAMGTSLVSGWQGAEWGTVRTRIRAMLTSSMPHLCLFTAPPSPAAHTAEPRVPAFPGQDVFPGRQLHSHSYRRPDGFKGQTGGPRLGGRSSPPSQHAPELLP